MSTVKRLQQLEQAAWQLLKLKESFPRLICKIVGALFIVASASLEALTFPQSPWLPPVYSMRLTVDEQLYPHRQDQHRGVPATALTFLKFRISPAQDIDVRLEGSFGYIHNHGMRGRSLALEVERQLTNDLVSDLLASSIGLKLETALQHSTSIPSFEVFAKQSACFRYTLGKHFSIKREARKQDAYSQWWVSTNLGLPTEGRPFSGVEACVKRVCNEYHTVLAALQYWQGFGKEHGIRDPLATKPFSMVDGVLAYRYSLQGMGSVFFALRHRFVKDYVPTLPLGVELRVDIPLSI